MEKLQSNCLQRTPAVPKKKVCCNQVLGEKRQHKLRWRIFLLRSKETPFTTPVSTLIENTFTTFKYSSFSRGQHVYKNVWILIIGDDSLTCKQEEHNENHQTAVAIIWVDYVQKIVGYVPLSWSKMTSKFLQIKNYHTRVEVIGTRVNHGVEVGLKIPLNCFLRRCQSYSMGGKIR